MTLRRQISLLGLVASAASAPAVLVACVGDDPVAVTAAGGQDAAPPPTIPPSDLPDAQPATDGSSDAPGCPGTQTACGRTCVDLSASSANCGRCGRDCGPGSTCSSNRCSPLSLGTGLDSPSAIVVTGAAVVAHTANMLVSCAKSGCAQGTTPLWSDAGWTTIPGALSTDGVYAFFLGTDPGTPGVRLRRATLGTTSTRPVNITTGATFNFAEGLASDDREHVFSTPYRNHRCFKGTCSSYAVLLDTETPTAIALTPTHYVWTMSNSPYGLQSCARPAVTATGYGAATNCGTVANLAPAPGQGRRTQDVATAKGVAYWTEVSNVGASSRVLGCAVTGCNATPTVIASGEERIDGLAADAEGVYWTNGAAGTIRVCRNQAAGCAGTNAAPLTLADGASNPGPIGTDQSYVYYAAKGGAPGTGALLRVAK